MDNSNIIECAGFYFIHNFDSGNLGHVECVPPDHTASPLHKSCSSDTPDYEFHLWTRPDCAGTEFENGNRTWFYFGIQAAAPNVQVRLTLINLNKQGKMYNQGMAPVTRTLPGKSQWERIKDKPIHMTDENTFTLSFRYRTSENPKATTFFAFTYPFSFAELQIALNSVDMQMLPLLPAQSPDDIYYCRECLIYSLEGRRVDLLTVSSHHGILKERETKLKNLFPETNQPRPFKFCNKKVIFVSARVHPGETPSSFVFNGFLNLLLMRNDPIAIQLRKLYVFKLVPFLNPDGVARGHYRTDTRGVNLNRVYLNPSLENHPTVYAARALIRYYHYGYEKEDDIECESSLISRSMPNINESCEFFENKKKKETQSAGDKGQNKRFPRTTANKCSGTMKAVPTGVATNSLCGDAANLIEQVYDMKLQEGPSETTDAESTEASLLTEDVLRSCLGSTVHLSSSKELILPTNPFKPLRDTLKNSISLLMESNDCHGSPNLRTGWCPECRLQPGTPPARMEAPVYHTIEEYREHQRNKIEEQEKKLEDMEVPLHVDNVRICSNCFRRYTVSGIDGEIEYCQQQKNREEQLNSALSLNLKSRVTTPPKDVSKQPPLSGSAGDTKLMERTEVKDTMKPPQKPVKKKSTSSEGTSSRSREDSGLFLYLDLHGHASKKGIFMYGNHFPDAESSVECMLLPRMMSLNSLHFHFSSCNFTERNMYLKDRRDGMSREGSGRVAVLKATGLVRSYTLECNYNTGRLVNALPPPVHATSSHMALSPTPPKYTPHIFEEVGRSLGASILDVTGHHPNSRVPCSEHRSLAAVREWLRTHTRSTRVPQITVSRLRPKPVSPPRTPLYTRSKAKVTDERKENTYVVAKTDLERRRSPPGIAQRSGYDIVSMKFGKKNEPVKSSSRINRYLAENEPKPKTLSTKRKNILAIRKPSTSKPIGSVIKASRTFDSASSSRPSIVTKLNKRSFTRPMRSVTRVSSNRCKAMASTSSSDDAIGGNWENVAGGTVLSTLPSVSTASGKRRSFRNQSPSRLKKIRLKNVS